MAWNDAPERTKHEVLDAFSRAIANVRARIKGLRYRVVSVHRDGRKVRADFDTLAEAKADRAIDLAHNKRVGFKFWTSVTLVRLKPR